MATVRGAREARALAGVAACDAQHDRPGKRTRFDSGRGPLSLCDAVYLNHGIEARCERAEGHGGLCLGRTAGGRPWVEWARDSDSRLVREIAAERAQGELEL